MDTRIRIRTILLIEKIKAEPVYADKISVRNTSYYRKDKKSGV